jgi:fibronectin type 3 domain-containing protein
VTLNPVATVAYKVSLTWAAPVASPVAVTGYRVYRGGVLLAAVTTLAYVDLTPVDGATYAYTVTSVSVTGAESTPSNVFSAVIP